jgi:hypothetical protein
MKHFPARDVEEAQHYASLGGQALHTHSIIVDDDKAPACFVRDVRAGREIAHLFDQDVPRLVKTARSLGVRVILVERRGQPGQHIDLCGVPLRKALERCRADAASERRGRSLFSGVVTDDGTDGSGDQ